MQSTHEVGTDIRENIAYPKKWQPKANPIVPFKEYPKMPLVKHRDAKGVLTGKADAPLYDTLKQPIIFENARAEAEWLEDHPKEAALIAAAQLDAPMSPDKLAATSDALRATQDRLEGAKAEIEEKDGQLADALAELAAAKALLASRKAEGDEKPKLDMRTKEGREAAKLAAQG
jgi:hypothetical protein